MINWLLALFGAVMVYTALVFFGNRWIGPTFGPLTMSQPADPVTATDEITITTWNIGYASLGAGADFIVDGGTSLRALDKPAIEAAAQEIGREIGSLESDVILLQETAGASYLTHGVSVRRDLNARMLDYGTCYWADFSTRFLPRSIKVNHGMSVYTRLLNAGCDVVELPQDPKFYAGFLKKYYGGIVTRYPVGDTGRDWVVINIHLSAFDDGARVRRDQLDRLFSIAQAEYDAGHYVVLGGDWNMRISTRDFPHSTAEEFLFWIHDFPNGALPDGWRFAVDESTPTVRTLHKPYIEGENYTMIIDGFAVSPNVDIASVTTRDLKFGPTDHHPVTARFSARAE